MYAQMNMDGWTDGQTGKHRLMDARTDRRTDEGTEGRTDRQMFLTFVKIIRVSLIVNYEKGNKQIPVWFLLEENEVEHSKNTRTRFYFCDKKQMHNVDGKTPG
jgi:hypothetical protein